MLKHKWAQRHGRDPNSFGPREQSAEEGLGGAIGRVGQAVAQGAKKLANIVAPDDATLLKNLEKDSGGRIPPQFEPKPEPKKEMESILKLAGLIK
jgi:hypothetical protein